MVILVTEVKALVILSLTRINPIMEVVNRNNINRTICTMHNVFIQLQTEIHQTIQVQNFIQNRTICGSPFFKLQKKHPKYP